MSGMNNDGNTFGSDRFGDSVSDLFCHLLLDLQSPGKDIDDTWDFGETDHFAIGNIGNMSATDNRKHMVFTQGIKLDIPDDNHFVIGTAEEGLIENFSGVLLIPFG